MRTGESARRGAFLLFVNRVAIPHAITMRMRGPHAKKSLASKPCFLHILTHHSSRPGTPIHPLPPSDLGSLQSPGVGTLERPPQVTFVYVGGYPGLLGLGERALLGGRVSVEELPAEQVAPVRGVEALLLVVLQPDQARRWRALALRLARAVAFPLALGNLVRRSSSST